MRQPSPTKLCAPKMSRPRQRGTDHTRHRVNTSAVAWPVARRLFYLALSSAHTDAEQRRRFVTNFSDHVVVPIDAAADLAQRQRWLGVEQQAHRFGDDVLWVTSLTAGSRQLLLTPRGREGPVQPARCYVQRVRLLGRDASIAGRRILLG